MSSRWGRINLSKRTVWDVWNVSAERLLVLIVLHWWWSSSSFQQLLPKMQFCVSNTDLEIIHHIKNESHTEFCTKQRLWEWWKVDKLSITWLLHSAVFCWIKTSTFRAYFLNRFSWICDHCNIFHLCDFSDSNTDSHSEATDPHSLLPHVDTVTPHELLMHCEVLRVQLHFFFS